MVGRALAGCAAAAAVALGALLGAAPARADGNLQNVNHIIIVMMENHSFDNYLGVLAYVPGTPYHSANGYGKNRACLATDHTCVDGLSCRIPRTGGVLKCRNANTSNTKGRVKVFHETNYCVGPDLDHAWDGTHREVNFRNPNDTLKAARNNGFVLQNALTELPDQAVDHDTMGYYTDLELPFYYSLAENFAIGDRYFASVLGQTFPNRAYFAAATSFGHLTTNEIIGGVAQGGYKPINGTIYDLMDQQNVSWTDYYSDLPYSRIFAPASSHQQSVTQFAADASAGTLPAVSFVDPSALPTQTINGIVYETDEHPPNDIRAGQYFVSTIITALRNSPSWNDSLLILTYDEHGGFYDHAIEPPALAPDNIAPGQCADLSSPPASTVPGGGIDCSHSSTIDAPALCPDFMPLAPYPADCATFNQYGVRLPFIAVSPFAKPHYVSHTVGDHTSLLALIEKRFLGGAHMTARDAAADTLEDMFDFDNSPSLDLTIPTAPLPSAADTGCPFS
ncbi:MAG TPA: alkaline phosphatase family protein [Candidatus Dormibacteraeota bacterium]|nr:alkaline phosphatase family protein [Candidatus Dormibacteraeota bacterium]